MVGPIRALLLLILCAVFAPGTASAYPQTTVGSWIVLPHPEIGSCLAGQAIPEVSHQDALLTLQRDRSSYAIRVIFPHSSEPDNIAYINGRATIDGTTLGLEGYYAALRARYGSMPYFALLFGPELRQTIADGQTLTLSVGSRSFTFRLDWSLQALDALDQCFNEGAGGSIPLTLAMQTQIVRDAALQSAANDPATSAECSRLGVGVGSADFAQCRMTIWNERAAAAARSAQRDRTTDALLGLSQSLLSQSAPPPSTGTTVYHFGGRVVVCTQTGNTVNCQ
jgi:hypothetical protein